MRITKRTIVTEYFGDNPSKIIDQTEEQEVSREGMSSPRGLGDASGLGQRLPAEHTDHEPAEEYERVEDGVALRCRRA